MNAQVFVNGLINAALIAPPAVAFSMLFGILRFANFAIGGYITVGVFAAFTANVQFQWPIGVALGCAMATVAVVAWFAERLVFRPMSDSAPVTLLVVSIALTFVLEHVVRLLYGADVRGLDVPLMRSQEFGAIRISSEQLYLVAVAVGVGVATQLLLKVTPVGKAMRAVADNPSLAEVRGIRLSSARTLVTLYCGALLGLSGVAAGLELVIEPMLGWSLTIPVIAAAILGGIGSVYGAMLGALLVGIAEELATLVVPPSYKTGVGFVLITILLLWRPHGLLGRPEIKK